MPQIQYEKTTEEMQEIYRWLCDLMGYRILRSKDDAGQRIFWGHIVILVDQSALPVSGKQECFRAIWKYLTGEDCPQTDCSFREEDTERYRFASELKNVGTHWKDLILQRAAHNIRRTTYWLQNFQKDILPFVDAVLETWEAELAPDLRNGRKNKFHSYQRMLTTCELKLEGVREAYELLDKIEE